MRGTRTIRHQLIERLNEVGHITAPHRLRRPRDLEALPREDIFKPAERKIVRILAGYDIGSKPGLESPLSMAVSGLFAASAGLVRTERY